MSSIIDAIKDAGYTLDRETFQSKIMSFDMSEHDDVFVDECRQKPIQELDTLRLSYSWI